MPKPPSRPATQTQTTYVRSLLAELELVRHESDARRLVIDEERAKTLNVERDLRVCREHLAGTRSGLERANTIAQALQAEVDTLTSQVADLTAAAAMPRRVKLPAERQSVTHHLKVGDADMYLMVGLYPSGDVGEIFLRIAKQGSETSGWADQFAQTFSMLLQQGVPLEDLARRFIGSRFEPAGFTNIPTIKMVTSPVDLVARVLLRRYVDKQPLDQ